MHCGPRDGATLKVYSDDKAAICQRLAVNDVSEGRSFVPGSNSNEVARLPGANGKEAGTAWTDIIGIGALLFVGIRILCLSKAYDDDDGKASFDSAAERVIQGHVAQTLTGRIRDCGGALIRKGNVHQ